MPSSDMFIDLTEVLRRQRREKERESRRRQERERRKRRSAERRELLASLQFACVNCDGSFRPTGSLLFCSELCQQEADYVRYHRRVLRDGRIDRPDVQEAMQIQLAHVLGGGYPARERRLSPEARAAVFAHDGGRCRRCGAPATSIDHIGAPIDGDINHRDNLQALCAACHNLKTRGQFVRMTPESHPEEWAKAQALKARVLARRPARPCDDEQNWETTWRRLAVERKAAALQGRR